MKYWACLIIFGFLSGCESGQGSATQNAAALPTNVQTQTSPQPMPTASADTSKALFSAWTDSVSGNSLDLSVITEGQIATTNVDMMYFDHTLNSWEYSTGVAWQTIQIGDFPQGIFVLGGPSPQLDCSNCSHIGVSGDLPWPAGTYTYSLTDSTLRVCNSDNRCLDLE